MSKTLRNPLNGLLVLAACGLFAIMYLAGATTVTTTGTPTYGVVEQNVTVGTTKVRLVPPSNVGFFVQPQTSGKTIRVGLGGSTDLDGTHGIIVQYLEALAEQPRPSQKFHEVWGISSSGDVTVRVVYYTM